MKQPFPWAFFALTYTFTWLVCLPGVLSTNGIIALPFPNALLPPIAQFGPSLAAFLLAYHVGGYREVLRLVKRMFNFRIPVQWLCATLLLPIILAGSAVYLNMMTGGRPPSFELLSRPSTILGSFLFIFFLAGPVPEEFGWRGYALDRLQSRWNALASSLILGGLWALWHLPLFFMGAAQAFMPLFPYLVLVVAFSVLMTWLYNNTGGNLLVALLFHTMINLGIALFPPVEMVPGGEQNAFIYLTILYLIAATLVVIVWGPQTLRRDQQRTRAPTLNQQNTEGGTSPRNET